MAPPADKQHDAGQFNAWLTNLGPSKGGSRPMPQRPPGAARPQAQPAQAAKQGGLLGSVDDELDDIFGRITTEDASPAAPAPTPAAAATRPAPLQAQMPPVTPPRQAPEVPRPPLRPQPAPQPQQAALDAMLARAQQAAPSRAAPQPQPPRPIPRVPEPPQFSAPPQQQQIQQPAPAQAPAAQVEAAVAEAKAAMQGQIKDLQAKYQEQRQKWEGLLSDLRARNDELHRQNQALEEELASLRERQRRLLAELGSQRQAGTPAAPSLQPVEQPQPAPETDEAAPPIQTPEISIEVATQPAGEFAGGKPEATFEIPSPQPEPAPAGEADDLLAELEALENEMKNLGGEGQG